MTNETAVAFNNYYSQVGWTTAKVNDCGPVPSSMRPPHDGSIVVAIAPGSDGIYEIGCPQRYIDSTYEGCGRGSDGWFAQNHRVAVMPFVIVRDGSELCFAADSRDVAEVFCVNANNENRVRVSLRPNRAKHTYTFHEVSALVAA